MAVKELIEKLQAVKDQDATVRITMWKPFNIHENPNRVETDDLITVDANEVWDDGDIVDVCDFKL